MNEPDGFWNRGVFLVCACVCVAFIVLMAAAMVLYPSGTPLGQTSSGYSFFDNFFSDLGMTRTPANESNHFSFALFTMALTAVGLTIACFFAGFGSLLSRSRLNTWLRAIAGVCGAIAGVRIRT